MINLLRFVVHWIAFIIVLFLTLMGVIVEKTGPEKLERWINKKHFNVMKIVWETE